MFWRRVNLPGLATIAAVLVAWEVVVRTGLLQYQYIPAPTAVWSGFVDVATSGELGDGVAHTVGVTLLGWAVAAVAGVTIGMLVGASRTAWTFTGASLETMRVLPAIAFVPLSVLLFGFTSRMELLIAIYGAVWPILLNTLSGMRSTSPQLLDVAKVMRLSPLAELSRIRIPAATAKIVVGLRLGLATSLILTLVAEMIGNPAGIGYALINNLEALQPERMFADIIVIGALGIALNWCLITLATLAFRGPMAAAREVD